MVTVGAPGVHGAVTAGTQGAGVKAPNLAAVAAATTGFVNVLHMAKGMTFFIGTKSIMVATGIPLVSTIFSGVTMSVLGATPKLHCKVAPL